jgi:hypothetical protein
MFCVESVLCERNVQEMIFEIVPVQCRLPIQFGMRQYDIYGISTNLLSLLLLRERSAHIFQALRLHNPGLKWLLLRHNYMDEQHAIII